VAQDRQLLRAAELHAQFQAPGSAAAKRLLALAEASDDIIFRFRLGSKPGFEYVNPAAERMTGYAISEFYADPNFGLHLAHPADRHLFLEFMQGHTIFGKPAKMRWIRRAGGILVTEQICIPVRNAFGLIIAIEGVARNVTRADSAPGEPDALGKAPGADGPNRVVP
jgi:PAS domain-containing protein